MVGSAGDAETMVGALVAAVGADVVPGVAAELEELDAACPSPVAAGVRLPADTNPPLHLVMSLLSDLLRCGGGEVVDWQV